MKFLLPLFLFSVLFISANSFIDDKSVQSLPFYYGDIDADNKSVTDRSYEKLLPFKLSGYSIFVEMIAEIDTAIPLDEFIDRAFRFSTLKGLTYIHPESGKEKLMINDAYVVDDQTLERVPDPDSDYFTRNSSFMLLEDDASVGEILLDAEVEFIDDNKLTIYLKNRDPIKFMVKLVDSGDYEIFYHIEKQNDSYMIYNAIKVRAVNKLLVWLIKTPDDFVNRLKSFFEWMKQNLTD